MDNVALKPPVPRRSHNTCSSWRRDLKSLRQPLKVGLAVLLASIVVLVDKEQLGLQTIWAPITVAQVSERWPIDSPALVSV